MRRVMIEQSIEDVTSIDANDLLFRIHVGEIGQGLTDHQRRTLIGQWSAVRNVVSRSMRRKLTTEQLRSDAEFFIRPLTDRRNWLGIHRGRRSTANSKSGSRTKPTPSSNSSIASDM